MGPSIILDKSAVESIGKDAVRVQSEYFYTVVTPVLVWEICGDIEKSKRGECDDAKVRSLAKKAKPFDSIVTTDWRKLCFAELSGFAVDIGAGTERRAVVDGSHRVPLPNGGYASVLDQQPEADALLRWGFGKWTEQDARYSTEWRRVTRGIDLERFRRQFGPARQPVESTEKLKSVVDQVLGDPALQYYYVSLLCDELSLNEDNRRRVLRRWRGIREWPVHARYARHCVRTFLTFYLALGSGLIGTNPTNRVDLEYLLYLPFAPIFISGDERSQARLVPLLHAEDQIFVRAGAFRAALQEHAERVAELGPDSTVDSLEPLDSSLIRELWVRVRGEFRPSRRRPPDPDAPTSARDIAGEFKKAMDYVNAHPELYPKRPPWPFL